MSSDENTSGGSSIKMTLRSLRGQKKTAQTSDVFVYNPYEKAENYMASENTGTGVNENYECIHQCDWDHNHPESPKRLLLPLQRLEELKLLDKCKRFSCKRDDIENIIERVHTRSLIHELKNICLLDIENREKRASQYDAIYFHENTYDAAIQAASSVVNLAEAICNDEIKNGFALVRPPGHHAMHNEYNGYCFFNNAAIAADFCLNNGLANKILIIDFDIHHGQGIQQKFYDTNRVLYFSVHRYQHGAFWPNLKASNFDHIGCSEGYGYNINVPLNETGLTDSDYLAIVFYLLLPVAYEYNPDLVIISAGYDCCIGCPEGEMQVTPGFYAHLVTLLSGLANGNTLVVLEGGYNVDSLSEGIAMTLAALLDYSCPKLEPVRQIRPSMIETINNVRRCLYDVWKCFQLSKVNDVDNGEHKCVIKYCGKPPPTEFLTHSYYPTITIKEKAYFAKRVQALQQIYNYKPYKVCYFYNEFMLQHAPRIAADTTPERPERLRTTHERITQSSVYSHLDDISLSPCDHNSCYNYVPHIPEYIDKVQKLNIEETKDLYMNEHTFVAVSTAFHAVLTLIEEILNSTSKYNSGIAVIRPPGHHAEPDRGMGFCHFNNIAIAANYLTEKYGLNRVLIIDFDVHHGNGTQKFFYDTDKIMYISVHRYDHGKFFPHQQKADYPFHGSGAGEGYNLNIPFSDGKMGDSEYMSAFFNIILPAAYSYGPDFVLVSAGFDAGIYDVLGGGYTLRPETFGHIITLLKPLANGRLILCLEGGYNITTLSHSMVMCCKALVGQPIPSIDDLYKNFDKNAQKTLNDVMDHFKQYWPVFQVNQKLSKLIYKKEGDDDIPYDLLNYGNADGVYHTLTNIPN